MRTFTVTPDAALQELTIAANFVEVYLAKEGHSGPVGINFLRKIELPIPFSIYGAMLAGVDYVIVGAGNPSDIPSLMTGLSRYEAVRMPLKIHGLTSSDAASEMWFDPATLVEGDLPKVKRPDFLAIVASVDLAEGLAGLSDPPDGYIVEAPSAGGHNAPPRGPRVTDDLGQPVYDDRDDVDLARLRSIGKPFWLAGSFGTPDGLVRAKAEGAAGVQIGTTFAFCEESGLTPDLKRQILTQLADGTLDVRSDWRASPTGFPFRIVQVLGTLSDDTVYEDRRRVCDLGALRVPYKSGEESIGYRCPAEPIRAYSDVKGGRVENTEGRLCLCNGLLATAGLAQYRAKAGYEEPPLVTAGSDFGGVTAMMSVIPPGESFYSASAVVDYISGNGRAAD